MDLHSAALLWIAGWILLLATLVALGLAVVWIQWKVRALARRGRDLEARAEADALDLAAARRSLEEQSVLDVPTGLHNRHFLETYLPVDLMHARRAYQDLAGQGDASLDQREDILLYLIEFDYFSQVGEVHGRAAQEALLAQLGQALQGTTRKTDFRVRWSGDRILLAARRSRRAGARRISWNLLALVRNLTFGLPGGETLRKRVSIGYAALPFHPRVPDLGTWEQALALAEQALGAAQRSGRDRSVGVLARLEADPGPLADPAAWDVPRLLAAGLADAESSEPNFRWPAGADEGEGRRTAPKA